MANHSNQVTQIIISVNAAISFCYNFSIRSARETVQLPKCLSFQALSALLFPITIYKEVNRKIFKSSSKLIDFQSLFVPHTLSYRHHSNF